MKARTGIEGANKKFLLSLTEMEEKELRSLIYKLRIHFLDNPGEG